MKIYTIWEEYQIKLRPDLEPDEAIKHAKEVRAKGGRAGKGVTRKYNKLRDDKGWAKEIRSRRK